MELLIVALVLALAAQLLLWDGRHPRYVPIPANRPRMRKRHGR